MSVSKNRLRKGVFTIFLILVSSTLLFFLLVIPLFVTHFMTHARTRPMDLHIQTTPSDLGVPYREVVFPAKTNSPGKHVDISAWYLPNDKARGIIIFAHGLFRSRQEVLLRAVNLWRYDYAALVFDFRRHGLSSNGKTSLGFLEQQDVLGAISFVKDTLNLQIPLITYGVSMGAAATVLANAESNAVDALIIDSCFLSFDHTITHHIELWLGWPRFPVGSIISALAKWRIGFTAQQFDMRIALDGIGERPVLVIGGEVDNRMPPAITRELFDACQGEKQLYLVPGARHGRAYEVDPQVFTDKIDQFLSRVISNKKKDEK